MNLKIEKVRQNLCKVKLIIPYNYDTLLEEFKKENWINHSISAERSGNPHEYRSVLPNPESKILKELIKYLSSDEVKKEVIDKIYDFFPDIQQNWDGWSKEKMYNVTLWGGQFLKDEPGFTIMPHIDTRIQILTSLIYFIEHNDPDQATIFYSDKNLSDPWVAETGIGVGTLHVNDFDLWHEGSNKSNKDRYLISLGLIINV